MNMIQNSSQKSGFTLVEMALVMLIIGLIIGAILGAGKIKENAQVADISSKFVLYESSAMKFREVYGELPGDLRDPAARLTNCATAPCTNAGNGDGGLDSALVSFANLSLTDERFSFWNHMLTAGFISGFKGANDMNFGEGQPAAEIGGGFRIFYNSGNQWWPYVLGRPSHAIAFFNTPSLGAGGFTGFIKCSIARKIDEKFDDGFNRNGKIQEGSGNCSTSAAATTSRYDRPGELTSSLRWITKF